MWISINTTRGQFDFDFNDKKDLDAAYNWIIKALDADTNGYVQLPQSKSSVVIFPANILRESTIQIGGIK